jgi:hypothetical protein
MRYLPLIACCWTVTAQTPRVVIDSADWPVKIGHEAQLFVDEDLIADKSGVHLQLHQPEKPGTNPLIVPTLEWERQVLAYGSILRDPASGKLRMWYTNNLGIAYAESRDGLHWEKPLVGMEIDGRRTNVLTRGHRGRSDTLTVFENPDKSDVPHRFLAYPYEYRYPDKNGVREQLREGIYRRTSPDGIHWTESANPVMYSVWRSQEDRKGFPNAALSDVNNITWDPKLKKYIGYVKIGVNGVRTRGITESDDGIYWLAPRLILRADEQDRPGDQLYSMVAFPYESMWIGFLGVFHKETDDRLDIQLVTSRDGRTWRRSIRETFIGNGPPGSFDEGVIHMAANPPLLIDGKLYLYYGGYGPKHGTKMKTVNPQQGIGVATLRPQGFVSVDAAGEAGTLITRPLHFAGTKLHLNAIVKPGGEIRVSLVDTNYVPIDSVSEPVTGDSLNTLVRGQGGKPLHLPAHLDAARLKFEMKNASLYAFWID